MDNQEWMKVVYLQWDTSRRNQQNDCAPSKDSVGLGIHPVWSEPKTNKMTVHLARTQISLGVHPVGSESSLYAQSVAKDQAFFMRTAKTDYAEWADAQVDLCLSWAHTILLFCHEAAQIIFQHVAV